MRILKFIKDWILIFAMFGGIFGYFFYVSIPFLDSTHAVALQVVETVQPLLIFAMLFLTFCKVNPRRLRLCPYHWWLLSFQTIMFIGLGIIVMSLPKCGLRIVLEGGMICFICPVATAGAVITKKLGGSASHIITYTILTNILAAIIIPIVVPFVHPQSGMSMVNASLLILGKVFPLLLMPLITAFLVRYLAPKLHFMLTHNRDLAFYLWVVALALATAVTTKYIVHSTVSVSVELWLIAVTFASCLIQFFVGWKIGAAYHDRITAGQSLGQKNTVLAIWLGYTYFTPITSVAGGFYSIFHNVINSLQLNKKKRAREKALNPPERK